MTVKRILSVVLSVMMIMASLVCVSAVSAAEITNVATNVYSVTVSVDVSSEIDGTMTAQILNADKSELFAIGFGDKNDETNTYEITLTMPEHADTGDYVVRIGGNVGIVEQPFFYSDVISLAEFYNDFISNQDNATELQAQLENCTAAPGDLTDYRALLPVVRKAAAIAFTTAEFEAVDLEADNLNEVLSSNKDEFDEELERIMGLAEVINVDTAEEMQAVIDNPDNTFDVYEGEEPLLLEVTADEVYTYYMEEVKSVDTVDEFTVENFALLFDRATLICIENEKDVDYLKNAFLYYEVKGSIDVKMSNINKLISKGADGNLWTKLYGKTNADIETLVGNAESIAKDLANGGGGGGGNGGADSDDSTDVPTSPTAPGAMIDKPTATVTFMDLGTAEWAREAIEALAARGVLNGKETGRFVPNDNVTREEITKIITSAFGLVQNDAECDFTDVDANRWSYVYVASASRLGIVNGYGADFGPANKTTREDMAVMIYRVLKLMNINVSGTAQNFSDAANISSYARDAVSALTSAGIINGMGDGTFAPKAYVTRAQIAKVAYELLNLAGGNQ